MGSYMMRFGVRSQIFLGSVLGLAVMLFMVAINMTTPPVDLHKHQKLESTPTPKPQPVYVSHDKVSISANNSAGPDKLPSPVVSQAMLANSPVDLGTFQMSVFDKIPDGGFDKLDPIQQSAFVNAEERFNAFFREWTAAGKTNSEEWNARVKEFHQEMLLNLGPEEMDRLLQPSTQEGIR